MSYLLDTNVCVYWLKGSEPVEHKAVQIGLENIVLSFITLSELYYGAYKSQRMTENLAAVRKLADTLGCIESDEEICRMFGMLKADLQKDGKYH